MSMIIETERFQTRQSTAIFILLTFVTIGFYYYYWLLSTSKEMNRQAGKAVVNETLVLLLSAFVLWSLFLTNFVFLFVIPITMLLANLLVIAAFIIGIMISLRLSANIKNIFNKENKNINIATWAVVLFQGWYLYYVIHNQNELQARKNCLSVNPVQPNQKSPYDELKELAKLRDDGILSNDEFEQQKKKLLGE